MTAFLITCGVIGWAAFVACVIAMFMGSAPTPKPVPTPAQVIWFRAVTKVASRRRA